VFESNHSIEPALTWPQDFVTKVTKSKGVPPTAPKKASLASMANGGNASWRDYLMISGEYGSIPMIPFLVGYSHP